MRFVKVHELGNDFVLFDGRDVETVDWIALSKKVCDRRVGVGADGVLILLRSAIADVRMRVIRADGSEAAANGIRAFSRYCFENGVVRGTAFSVETRAGLIKPRIILKSGRVGGVRIDMGEPLCDAESVPVKVDGRAIDLLLTVEDRSFSFSSVRVGEPHTIVFVDPLIDTDVAKYGPLIGHDPLFPEGTNVDFAEVLSHDRIRMRTCPRDPKSIAVDETGACAAAVACALSGKTGRTVSVEVERGVLLVEWSETDNRIYMTGPAEAVFSGIWNN